MSLTCVYHNKKLPQNYNSITPYKPREYVYGNNRRNSLAIRDVYPTGFHNLPVKVLIKIFQYSNERELRKSIMLVCRKWKNVAQLPELFQKLQFKGQQIPPNVICRQLRILTNLQKLQLFKIPDSVTVIQQICRCNQRLTSVQIRECSEEQPEGKLPESVLRNLVKSCTKLQEVDLKGTQFSGNNFYLELAILPEIKSINLSKNEYLLGNNLLELVLNCRSLEELKLSHCFHNQKLLNSDVNFLFVNLQSKLRSFSFDGNGLSDVSFKKLLQCKNLQKLVLYNAMNMSSETFIQIGTYLPNLEFLKIEKLTVPPEAYITLFTTYKDNLRKIQTLNFTNCWRFDTKSLDSIANSCCLLSHLVLKGCKDLTDVSILLEKCKNMKILNVAFCNVSNKTLSKIPVELTKLEQLFVDNNNKERQRTLANMKNDHKKLVITVCLSAFNKQSEEFKL